MDVLVDLIEVLAVGCLILILTIGPLALWLRWANSKSSESESAPRDGASADVGTAGTTDHRAA